MVKKLKPIFPERISERIISEEEVTSEKENKEQWDRFFKNSGYKLIKEGDLVEKESYSFFKVIGFLGLISLIILGGIIGYSIYNDDFSLRSILNNTNICAPSTIVNVTIPSCPEIPSCPQMNITLSPNINIYTNSS